VEDVLEVEAEDALAEVTMQMVVDADVVVIVDVVEEATTRRATKRKSSASNAERRDTTHMNAHRGRIAIKKREQKLPSL